MLCYCHRIARAMCILDGGSSKQIVGTLSGSIEGVFDDLLGSVQKKRLQVLAPLLSKACSATFDAVDGAGHRGHRICGKFAFP